MRIIKSALFLIFLVGQGVLSQNLNSFVIGPEIFLGPGRRPGIAVSQDGAVHVAYVSNSTVFYQKFMASRM